MTNEQFDNQLSTIKMINGQIETLKQEASIKNKELNSGISSVLETMTQRNNSFSNYIDLLKEFSFSDNLTSPSDLFPGIRTTSEMADPEELKKKTDNMKQYAATIDSTSKQLDVMLTTSIQNLKKELSTLIELSQLEGQFYDLCIDLLKDMNSIYDVGQLASNT